MRQIKSFAVLQTSKVMGVLYFLLGLLFVVFVVVIAPAPKGHGHRGLFVIVLAPVFYGVAGFVFTAIICWLYNAIARRIGGIQFEVSGEVQP
jgi:hypothetical protein